MARTFKEKPCEICEKKFIPTGARQRYCPTCSEINRVQQKREYEKLRRLRAKNEKLLNQNPDNFKIDPYYLKRGDILKHIRRGIEIGT
jgi:methionyl-tRNA synthetase